MKTGVLPVIGVAVVTLLGACATTPTEPVSETLDPDTATTVTTLSRPIELLSQGTRDKQTDPFAYIGPFETNRMGAKVYTVDQLKVIQEAITLAVFGVFSVYYFGDKLHWNHAVAFGCLVMGAFFMFHKF